MIDTDPKTKCHCWNSLDRADGYECRCPTHAEIVSEVDATTDPETRAAYEWATGLRTRPSPAPRRRAPRYAFGSRVWLLAAGVAIGATWGMVFGVLAGREYANLPKVEARP